MKYQVGYDFDDTLDTGITPVQDGVIVTGNTEDQEPRLREYLKSIGRETMKIIFFPGHESDNEDDWGKEIGKFKAEQINKLGLHTFLEDQLEQVKIIKQECPGVKVVWINEDEPRMKFIFVTHEGTALPVARKLAEEGNNVITSMVTDANDLLLPDEEEPEVDPEEDAKRLSKQDGLLKKTQIGRLVKAMERATDKSDIIFGNSNNIFKYTKKFQEWGYTGYLPTQDNRQMEVKRDEAKKLINENYPDIFVKGHEEFKTVQEAIPFIEQSQEAYVLKSLGDSGETVVPKTDDVESNHKQIIDALQANSSDYETGGFLLEEKILAGIELTPEAVFFDGELVFMDLDIETKTVGNAELGFNVGCGQNLIVRLDPESKLAKACFPQYVYDLAKQHKGIFVWDLAVMIDKKDGKMYALEFCPNRPGWDSFPTEISMAKDVTTFFRDIVNVENPLEKKFGFGTRLFNLRRDKDNNVEADSIVDVEPKASSCVYLYDVKRDGDNMVTCGYEADLGVATGVGDSVDEAINEAFEYAKGVRMTDIYYRSEDDARSLNFTQSILNRLYYAVKNQLIDVDESELPASYYEWLKKEEMVEKINQENNKNATKETKSEGSKVEIETNK